MNIEVKEFEPGDEHAARRAYEITRATRMQAMPDAPFVPFAFWLHGLQHPDPGYGWVRALATLDGVPAGHAELGLPLLDNPENADLGLFVEPSLQRRGVGRALHEWAADRARAAGRKRLTGSVADHVPGAVAFCERLGATAALPELRSRLDLTTADHDRFAAMLAEAWRHAGGYRLVTWLGVPPDEFIDDVAELDSSFLDEAPTGELQWEAEKVDADRLREAEQLRVDRGTDRIHAGAVHEASGKLVAWTTLSGANTIRQHLWQGITLVHHAHRGHRLGLVVKLENLKRALELRPGLAAIDTWNATTNEHMLAINRAMGFRVVDSWAEWQETI